jgi:hypothetical protein
VSSAESTGRLGVFRWLVALVFLALIGVVGFVAYTRYGRQVESAGGSSAYDARLDVFLARADERVAVGDLDGAKEQYLKASGLSDTDPRVAQGLARVEIVRTELAWWKWLAVCDGEHEERDAAELALTRAAKAAADAIDRAMGQSPTDPTTARLQVDRQRIDAMVVVALARAGKQETAEKSLDQLAARNRSHPMLDALRRLVDDASKSPAPDEADEEPEPDASATPSSKPTAPRSTIEHFEFDHEPVPPVKTPGELEIPVTPQDHSSPAID